MTDYKLVPVEPTAEMLEKAGAIAGYDIDNSYSPDEDHIKWWKDMLAAAPSPAWIKVSERLPALEDADRDGYVWVYYPGPPRGLVDEEHIYEFGTAITHWMPKPLDQPPSPPERE